MSNDPPPYYPAQGYPVSTAPNTYTTGSPGTPGQPYPAMPGSDYPSNCGATGLTGSNVVLVGGCPTCRVGTLIEEYDTCGIILAICFFPMGVLCCLAMRRKVCANCGEEF